MSKLTTYKKYIVYNKMRDYLQTVSDEHSYTGFCSAFPSLMLYFDMKSNNIFEESIEQTIQILLPELYLYKPINNEDGPYWYDRTDIVLRIWILNIVINSVWVELNMYQKIYITLFKKGMYPPLSKREI